MFKTVLENPGYAFTRSELIEQALGYEYEGSERTLDSHMRNLRRKIEDRGTQHFPEAAGNKLYGELTMIVTVNHDGRVLDTEVVESSGITALDRRAQSIAKAAGPFGKFSDTMRRRADQIVVVSRFKFTREETLETKLQAR